jgi:hypothetical protein
MAPCLGACFPASLAALGLAISGLHVPWLLTRFRISDSDIAPVKRKTSPARTAAASIQWPWLHVYTRLVQYMGRTELSCMGGHVIQGGRSSPAPLSHEQLATGIAAGRRVCTHGARS